MTNSRITMKRFFDSKCLQFFLFLVFLYFFFVSIELMSSAFKMFGRGFAEKLILTTMNPLVGIFIGILTTSIVQSSSCVTSILVGLVAAETLSIRNAIPMVMGANIGTTITATIVAMGHIKRRPEFSKAFTAATVQDLFKIFTAMILFPLEISFHPLEKVACFLAELFKDAGGLTFLSPLSAIVNPSVHLLTNIIRAIVTKPAWLSTTLVLVVAIVLLFFALAKMVTSMKKIMMGKVENLLNVYIFNSPFRSFLLGLFLTSTIQSSSVTTSLLVPIAAAGILTIQQIFPYILGCDIGTTVTAILASFITKNPAALAVAFAHLLFNITGTSIFYPLRIIPITCAQWLGRLAATKRALAVAIVVVFFFIIPLTLIVILKGEF